ncbi:MAG: LytR/AlgR family response regulator transcription factor [Bacteroidia bacterium]
MLNAIIIDDESAGISSLKQLIDKYITEVKVCGTALKATDGIELINTQKPDIVFLDIDMPHMNGLSLLKELEFRDFALVFTTAHDEYALQAIKLHAFDYLLKPVDTYELKSCVNRILEERSKNTKQPKTNPAHLVGISVKDGIIFIKQRDIIRLEASGSYTTFYLEQGVKHVASKSLKEYETQLDQEGFYRCHNSHIINLSKVVKFVSSDGFFAQMSDGSLADISRKNKDEFLELLKK